MLPQMHPCGADCTAGSASGSASVSEGSPPALAPSAPAAAPQGGAPELPPGLWAVVWRHSLCSMAKRSPLPDLRAALAATCVCRAWRGELREAVARGSLERPSQALLRACSRAFPRLEELQVDCGQGGLGIRSLDFNALQWPALRVLRLHRAHMGYGVALPAAVTSAPRLRELSLEQATLAYDSFSPRLAPSLEVLRLHRLLVGGFGVLAEALDGHPRLRAVSATQLREDPEGSGGGYEGETFTLRLPQCETLRLACADLTRLRLWAPRLRRLDLGGCRHLRSLRLLDNEPPAHDAALADLANTLAAEMAPLGLAPAVAAAGAASSAAPPPPPPPPQPPPQQQPPAVRAILAGTEASRYTLKHLRTHARVGPQQLTETKRKRVEYDPEYDSDGRLSRAGSRGSRGSSFEDDASMQQDNYYVDSDDAVRYDDSEVDDYYNSSW